MELYEAAKAGDAAEVLRIFDQQVGFEINTVRVQCRIFELNTKHVIIGVCQRSNPPVYRGAARSPRRGKSAVVERGGRR